MSKAKTIATFGPSRAKVFVKVDGSDVVVKWRVNGQRRQRKYPNTVDNRAAAKEFAKGVVEARERPAQTAPMTLRTLWERYADAEFPHLRPNSRRLYREYYARWETAWGRDFRVEHTSLDMAHTFRRDLAKLPLSTSTIRQTIRVVQMVYSWGERNELISVNKMRLYRFKVAKDERKESPAEYRDEEFAKILAALDPTKAGQWRAWVALAICGAQGVRQNAVLHLRWEDVDYENGVIHWRKAWDKVGRDWSQPMRALTREALRVAAEWKNKPLSERPYMRTEGARLRHANAAASPWVVPSGSSKSKSPTYSIQSLWGALIAAEERADVKHLKHRGGHGLRRLLAGNVAALTGDAVLAMRSIGDTDVRMSERYLKPRHDRVKEVFDELDRQGATE